MTFATGSENGRKDWSKLTKKSVYAGKNVFRHFFKGQTVNPKTP